MKKIFGALTLLLIVKFGFAQVCFEPSVNYSTPSDAFGICKGDFNGDGHIDIASTNRTNNQVSVFFGDGAGVMNLNQNVNVSGGPEGIISADFTGDGILDLATANNNSGNVAVLFNNGLGVFSLGSQISVDMGPKRLVAYDFNADGFKDVAVGCFTQNTMMVLLGNGAGTFTTTNVYSMSNPMGICGGDFNNDGNADVATTNNGAGQVLVRLGNGDGTFQVQNSYGLGGTGPYGITSDNINGDANIDLLVANNTSNNIGKAIGPGTGTFNFTSSLPANAQPRAIALGDFNLDGNKDMAVALFGPGEVGVYLGDGMGNFAVGINFSVGGGTRDVVVADFNEDGKDDIATANINSSDVSILLNSLPTLNVTGSTAICNGSSTILTASGASVYAWSANAGSATTATVALSPTVNTTYTVTGSNSGCGVSLEAVTTVTVNPIPTMTVLYNGPSTICQGDSTGLRNITDPGTTTVWMPGNITGTLVTVTPTVTTTYTTTTTFTATGCSNTVANALTITVNTSPSLTVAATATLVCSGTGVTLTATGASTYTWTGGISNGVAFTPTASATYTVTGTGGNSCTSSKSQAIVVNPLPTVNASASATVVCAGTPITLTASGTATTYTWSGGITDGVPFPAVMQTYTVTGTGANSCVNTATISINAPATPAPDICLVTVDSLSVNNLIVWDKTLYPNADTFFVHRDTANNNYVIVGTIPVAALSQFADTARSIGAVNGDPNITTYRYKLSYRDTCGTMSPMGPYHNTIYNYNSGSLFLWNHYEIQGQTTPVPGLSNYVLKRDNLGGTGNYVTAATAGASSTNINDPQYATWQTTADWRVETIWNITCTPSLRLDNNTVQGTIVKSKSNITNNKTTSITKILDRLVSVYPNPAHDNFFVHFNSNVIGKLHLKIYSVLGDEVYNELLVNPSGDILIDLNKYENGLYLLQLVSDAGTISKRIIKN